MNKRITLIVLGVFVVGAVAAGARFRGQTKQEPQRGQAEDEHRQLVDAVRKGGLREAARLKGSYVITRNASWDAVFSDIESLTSHSALVVLGVPVQSTSRISSEGNTVLTDFKVNVVEALKGEVTPGSFITISAVGGFVRFDDGTSVEVRTPDLEIRNGNTYAFFLSEKDRMNAFHITGGSQGVFELHFDGAGVVPQGRKTDLVVEKYKGKPVERFLLETRQAAEKWPANRKCCPQ